MKVIAYKNNKKWAENVVKTTDKPMKLLASAAFGGLCLVIVRSEAGKTGSIALTAKSTGLKDIKVIIKSK